MANSNEGYPFEKALGLAVKASEELKSFFRNEGLEGVVCIAGVSGWGQVNHGHPNVGIYLPKEVEPKLVTEVASEIASRIETDGVRVSIYPFDSNFPR